MEGVRSTKPSHSSIKTGCDEMEGVCGSTGGEMGGQSSSSSSSSKPPSIATSPVRLHQKQPQPHDPHSPDTVDAIANTEQDMKQQHQATTSDPKTEEIRVLPPSDPRRLKRAVSNRMSAQKSRLRKFQYVTSLERQSGELENQIAFLKPQVAAYSNNKQLLMMEQMVLRQKLAALEMEITVKQVEIERNQAEVHMLREVEKRQKEEARAMMAHFNWDAASGNQFVPEQMAYTDVPAQVFGGSENNEEGTSGMKVDEQTQDSFYRAGSVSELDAIVNPPKQSDQESDPVFYFGF